MNNRINHIHEEALKRVVYTSFFDELLLKNNSFRIGHRNIQTVAIVIFKVKLVSAPETMKNIFSIIENTHDLRNGTKLKLRNIPTVRCGIETASFVAPRIWSSISRSYKERSSINEFTAKINFLISRKLSM